MADDIDFEAARAGDKDLARRDLRDALLGDLDLSGVDLTGAHLERSQLQRANLHNALLSSANLMNADMKGANLSAVIAPSTVFFGVNLEGADMRGANLGRSHFTQANMRGSDLRGADFREAVLGDGNDFTEALIDEKTLFDGAQILRTLARQDAFRYYEVQRGVLVRRSIDSNADAPAIVAMPTSHVEVDKRHEAVKRISELLDLLGPLTPGDKENDIPAGMGHNNPPESTPLDRPQFDELTGVLSELAVELNQHDLKTETISEGTERLDRASSKVTAWISRKADLAADECMKQFGKSLADARLWMAGWFLVSGKLSALVEVISAAINHH